jgi:hypothetical protein
MRFVELGSNPHFALKTKVHNGAQRLIRIASDGQPSERQPLSL